MTGCTEGQSPDYFRLHINNYSCVETVTCLSSKVRAVLDSMLIKIAMNIFSIRICQSWSIIHPCSLNNIPYINPNSLMDIHDNKETDPADLGFAYQHRVRGAHATPQPAQDGDGYLKLPVITSSYIYYRL